MSTKAPRRALLGAAAVLPTISIAGGTRAEANHQDARLVAIGAALRANYAERDRIAATYSEAPGFSRHSPEDEMRAGVLSAEREALEAEMALLPATTIAGFAAKAVSLLDEIDIMEDGQPFEGHALRYSLLQDLLRAGGA